MIGGFTPARPFPSEAAGNISRGSSSTALVPAVAWTSTSTGPLNPPLEGTTLASPLVSLLALLCVTFYIFEAIVQRRGGDRGSDHQF